MPGTIRARTPSRRAKGRPQTSPRTGKARRGRGQAFDFDLFVIGGGSGGVRAARVAAGYGARVMVAEEYRIGGTCVIRGCVPKKLLVYASRFRDEFEDAAGFGWTLPEPRFDWPALIANKDREIARLEAVYRSNLAKAAVTIFDERAVLEDAHSVLLASGQVMRASTILIATGAKPFMPAGLPGVELAISSNEAFQLASLPRRILISGGGYIAIEFAGIFAGLGSEVAIVYRGEGVLRGFDADLRAGLAEEYAKRGIRILTGRLITGISRQGGALAAALSDGTVHETDQVMLALGRLPNTAGLGLENAGVLLDPADRAVVVDAQSRSNVPNIYAVGDVTDRVNLTPVAIREGHAFADTVFGGMPTIVDHAMVPTAVFSTPELGTVGMAEHVARECCPAVDVYKSRFRPLKHTLSGRDESMLMKLVVDASGGRVLGCHVLGPDAAEIVQMAGIAMRMGATKADFDATMALHPTVAEELVTMRTKWLPAAESIA